MIIVTFLLLYGGMHLHFFLRLRAAFAPGTAVQVLLAGLLLVGLLTPILVRAAERFDLEMAARGVAWIGYLWMAVLFLFFSASLLVDLYRLLVWVAGRIARGDLAAWLPSVRTVFLLPLAAALALAGYGYHEAGQIRVERLEIRSEKIPRAFGPIRIVQISDVHIGVLVRGERLERLFRAIREAGPDLLVSTGDLVDGQGNDLTEAAARFREIRPRYGKYAVTGNHEFYIGLDHALDFTRQAGFITLRNETATIAAAITLAGVDDPTIRPLTARGRLADREILAGHAGRFTILLKHQPLVEPDAPGAFDLQLSGHTHRGQIFPFALITSRVFQFHSGTYRLERGALLHVSRGTGTWGPPVRLLAPPEITVIDLIPG
jgi:hypothetical protein